MFRPVPLSLPARGARFLLASLALVVACLTAAPAQAAVISFSGADPKGDGKSVSGLDLTKAEATYDNATGAFKASVTTASEFDKAQGLLNVIYGTAVNGVCDYADPGKEGLPPFLQIYQINIGTTPIPAVWSYSTQESSGPPEVTKSGLTTTFTIPATAPLAGLPFDCLFVATAYETPNGGDVADQMSLSASAGGGTGGAGGGTGGSSGGGTGGGTGGESGGSGGTTAPLKIVTTDPDADKDGVPDSLDRCPKVAGALATGCAVMKPADEIRLGAKRVVVDKLVPLTAKTCPPRVRITATSKRKKLGTGVFTVDQHGSFCRVKGIVRLKKKQTKQSKVRVVSKGTGMGSIAKTVKR